MFHEGYSQFWLLFASDNGYSGTNLGTAHKPAMKENQHTEWKEVWRDDYLRWV